jgi:hypothetical protein
MKNLINFEDFWSEENRGVIVPEELISAPEVPKPKSETKRKRRDKKKGLWFKSEGGRWATTIPGKGGFDIWYDGRWLGAQSCNFELDAMGYSHQPHIIKLKKHFDIIGHYPSNSKTYDIGRKLNIGDFEIIPNPHYESEE